MTHIVWGDRRTVPGDPVSNMGRGKVGGVSEAESPRVFPYKKAYLDPNTCRWDVVLPSPVGSDGNGCQWLPGGSSREFLMLENPCHT